MIACTLRATCSLHVSLWAACMSLVVLDGTMLSRLSPLLCYICSAAGRNTMGLSCIHSIDLL